MWFGGKWGGADLRSINPMLGGQTPGDWCLIILLWGSEI